MNVKSYDILRRKSYGHFMPGDFAKLKQLARETIGESNEYLQIELNHHLDIFSQLDSRIDSLETEITEIIDELKPPCLSVKGVGVGTAAVIVAEIGNFSRFNNVDKCLAFAGLEPQKHDSGQSHRDGKMHKHGSKYLREALMNVVIPLIRSNVVFAEYYRKKRAEDKTDLIARSHTAQKLLCVIYALHTRNVPYDPDKLI
jgi:transposase